MDKTKLNFFIDALMFLTMMALAGLGLLIKYVLIPGRKAWAQYGRQMELTWLGLDRHAWGAVHSVPGLPAADLSYCCTSFCTGR